MMCTSSRCAVTVALAATLLALVTAGVADAESKFPIATGTAEGQLSLGHVAFDGTNYLVGIQGDATGHSSVGAQLVSQSGTLVGSLISTGRTGGAPGAGFDGTNYLLVWSDDGTTPQNQIYGQRISPSGSLVGAPFQIGPTSGGQELTGGTFDGTNFLILWRCSTPGDTCAGIYGQLVAPSGALVGPVITVSDSARKDARIAFDGSNYLVIWHGAGAAADMVFGRFVSPAGTLPAPAFVINASPAPSDNPPAIAFGGTNYLVVWPDELGGSGSGEWHLFGQLVTPTGALSGGVIAISTAAGAEYFPSTAFDGKNYLVTWTNFTCNPPEGTCADVYGQYFSKCGTAVSFAFPVAAGPGSQLLSAATFAAGQYLVTWNDGATFSQGDVTGRDVYGTFLAPAPVGCVGDCGRDGRMTVDEILTMVNVALGNTTLCACETGDANADGQITIDEILRAVNNALTGCPVPTATGTWDCISSTPGTTVVMTLVQSDSNITGSEVTSDGYTFTITGSISGLSLAVTGVPSNGGGSGWTSIGTMSADGNSMISSWSTSDGKDSGTGSCVKRQ